MKITTVAVGDGGVWLTAPAAVLRVDPTTLRQVATIPVDGTLDRIDAASGAQHTIVIKNEQSLTDLVTAFGRIWLFSTDGGVEAADIDPATDSIVGPPIALPGRSGLGALAAAGYGAIWLITGENRLIELVPS